MNRKAVWLTALSLAVSVPLTVSAAEGDKASRQGQQGASTKSQAHAQDTPVSDIIGKAAYSGDESVGDIDELLMDRKGQVTAAVIDVGGFLGMGSKKVAVDFNKLKMDRQNDRITLSMNKQQLQQAPEFQQTAQAPDDSESRSNNVRPRTDQ